MTSRWSLWAVHLSDGVLADGWIAGGFIGAILLVAMAMWYTREEDIPRIGVLSAAFFVGSSIHIPLAALPTSVHLILNGLVGVVLGRQAPLAIVVGLTLQYLLLQHGGLTTLGVNACIVGVPALLAGVAYPLLRRLGVPAFARGVVLGGGAVGASVLLNFLVLLLGGKEDWEMLAKLVLLAHIPVVVIEGLMLGVLVRYLERVKPEFLQPGPSSSAAG
ncbi:MAG: CbiM family transporter [Gemmataceae bacterium]|nr:CbiM family transporter [Gemmata sp.]MDW8198053.1 CbiM family transporter [Gemmataceae bacterium]